MKSLKLSLAVAALVATAGSAMAADAVPYLMDSANQVVKSGSGLCVRTGFWTPALAQKVGDVTNCQCDQDIAPCKKAAPAKKKKPAKVTLNADAVFAFGSAKISAEGQAALNSLISSLAGVNVDVVLATGYTDRIGSDAANQKLSDARAEAVKAYLAANGVAEDRIQPLGLGSDNPVVECAKNLSKKELIKCLAPNRRTEVEVFGSRAAK
ncbi:MAG TPA: hypothetical protein DD376_03000 [Sutterella sp.]|nr:hypothetical protein [Sutterella sp.]